MKNSIEDATTFEEALNSSECKFIKCAGDFQVVLIEAFRDGGSGDVNIPDEYVMLWKELENIHRIGTIKIEPYLSKLGGVDGEK